MYCPCIFLRLLLLGTVLRVHMFLWNVNFIRVKFNNYTLLKFKTVWLLHIQYIPKLVNKKQKQKSDRSCFTYFFPSIRNRCGIRVRFPSVSVRVNKSIRWNLLPKTQETHLRLFIYDTKTLVLFSWLLFKLFPRLGTNTRHCDEVPL